MGSRTEIIRERESARTPRRVEQVVWMTETTGGTENNRFQSGKYKNKITMYTGANSGRLVCRKNFGSLVVDVIVLN